MKRQRDPFLRLQALRQRDQLRVVGLMSGTSADGIDSAAVLIDEEGSGPRVRLVAHRCDPHDAELGAILRELGEVRRERDVDAVDLICRASFAVAEAFAQCVERVRVDAGWGPEDVDLVGSHGQTIRHRPDVPPLGRFDSRSTLQIGQPAVLAERTGAVIISDFRARDVAAGGQGAPLVPHIDHLLFAHPDRIVACQNFGGIGNVSYLPRSGTDGPVIAFDTGPANMVMDTVVRRLTGGAEAFDRDGLRARRGRAHEALVDEVMRHPFLERPPPKSAGREDFGESFADGFWARCESLGLSGHDRVATALGITVEATARAYERFLAPMGLPEEMICSGGGAANPALMESLARRLPSIRIVTSDERGVPSQAKEALAFAVLAHETLRGRHGNRPSATGARRPVILGQITV